MKKTKLVLSASIVLVLALTVSTKGTKQKALSIAEGAKSQVFRLPEMGIYGNDHMMFQDLNNAQIADLVEDWIKRNAK